MAKSWWKKDELTKFLSADTPEWQELQTPEGLAYFFTPDTITNQTTWERPDALKTADDLLSGGDWVWAPHPQHCFVPAKIYAQAGGMITLQGQDGEQYSVKTGTALESLKLSSLQRIVADLVLLDEMNNPLILFNLRKRFERDDIYTNVGTILISINPYKHINLYKPDVIQAYQYKGIKEMPPHVFNIAGDALYGVTDGPGHGQAIIISGESGAGKTEATKQCLSFVAAVAGSVGGIEQKILQSNPILEGFGNAKTIRNDNSSRFGKYIEVFLNPNGVLCGSRTTNFLLEKVRVIHQAPNERNFHVFYQLTSAASDADRRKFELGGPEYYRYLCMNNCMVVNGIDDASDYADLLEAMTLLDFTDSERHSCFSVVAAVLHIGNMDFDETGDKQCRVRDATPLNAAARLLEVEPAALTRAMAVRQIRIAGQKNTDVTLSVKEAEDCRDALAKFLYGALFDWLVQKINRSMLASSTAATPAVAAKTPSFGVKSASMPVAAAAASGAASWNPNKCIGILDIFGFEIFEQNSFEQLCINFCNEKLQHHFSDHTFKLEESVYLSEGIQFDKIKYIDNQPVLDLIEARPSGILRILDEELIIPRGCDATFLAKTSAAHAKNPSFKAVMKNVTSFSVIHYAGLVTYDATNFLEKNRDTLTEDGYDLLGTTKMKFIFELFPRLGEKVSSKERKASLGFQFSKQLDTLMSTLNLTEPHYIRCVKPNNEKRKDHFIAVNVMEQLRYSGVFEAVQIRRSGFPFRQTHPNFVERYKIVNMDKQYPVTKQGCQQIMADMKLNPVNVQMGKSMVLYRSEEYKVLELHRSINLEKSTLIAKLQSLVARDPTTEKDPELYFQELSRTVKRAKELNFTTDAFEQARATLFAYIENRIDPAVRAELEAARASRDIAQLESVLAVCDQNEFDTSLVRKARLVKDRLCRIVEEANTAMQSLEERHMNVCLKASDEIGLRNEIIEYFRALLQNTPADVFLKEQMKAAVRMSDHGRAIRISLRLKEMVLNTTEESFTVQRYGKLKPPKDWAEEKFFCFDREKLAMSMFTFSDDWSVHSPLIDFENVGLSPEAAEKLNKQAQTVYDKIGAFCEDKEYKSAEEPYISAQEVLVLCLANPHLRDEAYLFLIKQLTRNPNNRTVPKIWDLMAVFLCFFPPNPDFENFLEVFLRQQAQPREKYVGALHKIVYEGVKVSASNPPAVSVVQQSAVNLTHRARGFSEPLPPAAPCYLDLMTVFEEVDPEAEHFSKKAPKKAAAQAQVQTQVQAKPTATSGAQAKFGGTAAVSQAKPTTATAGAQAKFGGAQASVAAKPAGPPPKKVSAWQAAQDPASGDTYYYNAETGESSWDMPNELKYKHIRAGSRV